MYSVFEMLNSRGLAVDVLETAVDYLKGKTLEQLPDVLVGFEEFDELRRDLIVTHNGSCCLKILSRTFQK